MQKQPGEVAESGSTCVQDAIQDIKLGAQDAFYDPLDLHTLGEQDVAIPPLVVFGIAAITRYLQEHNPTIDNSLATILFVSAATLTGVLIAEKIRRNPQHRLYTRDHRDDDDFSDIRAVARGLTLVAFMAMIAIGGWSAVDMCYNSNLYQNHQEPKIVPPFQDIQNA